MSLDLGEDILIGSTSVSIIRKDGASLTLDIAGQESFAPQIEVTDHPIEDGGSVTDNVKRGPMLYSLPAKITESPLETRMGPSSKVGLERVNEAREFLAAIVGELVSISTLRYGVLDNMLLSRFDYTADQVRWLPLSLEFKQARIAVATTVVIPPTRPATTAAQVDFATQAALGISIARAKVVTAQASAQARGASTLYEWSH